jgi:GTP cyclohydrolase I
MEHTTKHDTTEQEAQRAVQTLLRYIGEDPEREGLQDTPARVVRAWDELTEGYEQNPEAILERDFDGGQYDEMIALPYVEFHSTCEHHLLPFSGYAHIAYLPARKNPRVVGLSKMARLVDCFARRLQIQEKMTREIACAMSKHLRPAGVAVVVQAKHLCMSCRGVKKHKGVMVTSSMIGAFRKSVATRNEFFRLVDLASKQNGQF